MAYQRAGYQDTPPPAYQAQDQYYQRQPGYQAQVQGYQPQPAYQASQPQDYQGGYQAAPLPHNAGEPYHNQQHVQPTPAYQQVPGYNTFFPKPATQAPRQPPMHHIGAKVFERSSRDLSQSLLMLSAALALQCFCALPCFIVSLYLALIGRGSEARGNFRSMQKKTTHAKYVNWCGIICGVVTVPLTSGLIVLILWADNIIVL